MVRSSAYFLAVSSFLLIATGFVMLFSTAAHSVEGRGDALPVLKRQALWLVLGLISCAVTAAVDYRFWRRHAVAVFWVTVVLLSLCFVPGVGMELNGARRWISLKALGLPGVTGQPSELARLGIVISLAAWCARFRDQRKTFLRGFVLPLIVAGIPVGLIAAEVDLGAASLIFAVCVMIIYLAGTRVIYVLGTLALGGALLWGAIQMIPNRAARVEAFIQQYTGKKEASGETKVSAEVSGRNYQGEQGLLAFGNGGLSGLGLGNSRQKHGYLPLPHTDFIFAILGEELGLAGCLSVVVLFVSFTISGALIALHAPDRFGKLLGFGLVGLVTGQAVINMGVTTGLLPNKGMPLPFISYGGSNLFFCLTAVGILLNVHRHGRDLSEEPAPVLGREKLTPAV